MAATTTDAISSFAHLLEVVPKWKDQVSELIIHTSQKQEEFRAEYARILHEAKPRRVKTESICSIHTHDDDTAKRALPRSSSPTPTPPNLAEISPLVAGNRYIYAQANKKRKPGTSFGSGASGPVKFRSKQSVVIYYDSFVQQQCDSLVRGLGASRNILRKGRLAYTVSQGLQLPSLRRSVDPVSSNPSVDRIRSTSASRSPPKSTDDKDLLSESKVVPSGETAFLRADKQLENCQNLCETAAHQFLRDGDCKLELDTVLKDLDIALDIAKSTYETLKVEEEKDEKGEETTSNVGSTHTASDSTLVEKPSREYLNYNHKILPGLAGEADTLKRPVPTATFSAPLPSTEIEVDDESDSSSYSIDVSRYRLNNPARLRI